MCIVTLDVKLKTSLFLSTALTVLVILGLSEWLSYRQMTAFFRDHMAIMQAEMNHADQVASLRQGREALAVRLVWVHVLHAAATVAALILVLNTLCNRIVLSPLQELLRHINYMGRGTWKAAIPIRRKDEIGQLTKAFNELGDQLSLTVQRFAAASKLSTMALLGQRLVTRTARAKEHLQATTTLLSLARDTQEPVPELALRNLAVVIELLEEIPVRFEAEFEREFRVHSARPASKSGSMPQDEVSA